MFSRGTPACSWTTSRTAVTSGSVAPMRSNVAMAAFVLPSSSRRTAARMGSRAPEVLRGWPMTGVSGGGVMSASETPARRFESTSSARTGCGPRAHAKQAKPMRRATLCLIGPPQEDRRWTASSATRPDMIGRPGRGGKGPTSTPVIHDVDLVRDGDPGRLQPGDRRGDPAFRQVVSRVLVVVNDEDARVVPASGHEQFVQAREVLGVPRQDGQVLVDGPQEYLNVGSRPQPD